LFSKANQAKVVEERLAANFAYRFCHSAKPISLFVSEMVTAILSDLAALNQYQ